MACHPAQPEHSFPSFPHRKDHIMVNTWFVMIPPTYQSKSDAEKELVDFRIQYPAGSQAWKDANAGRIVRGAEGETGNPQISEDMIKWKGPFANENQAKAAQNPQQQSLNPVNDAVNAAQNATSNPISGVTDFLTRLTEAHTWIRVAEVVLGVALAIVALDKVLAGTPAGNVTHTVAKAAFLA